MPRRLRPEDFGNVTFADPTSNYVPENLQAIAGTTQALESAYQRNLGEYKKLDLALASLRTLPQDQPIVKSRIEDLRSQLDNIRSSGEFEMADLQIEDAARSFATDEIISKSVEANKQRQQNIEAIMKDPNYRTQQERLAAIALSDARYQGVQRVDPKTLQPTDDPSGIVIGDYMGYTPGKRVDITRKADQLGSGYKADTLANQGVQFDPSGRIITQSLAVSGVNEATIRNDLAKTFANDPEIQSTLRQDFELSAIQTNPEFFTNGQLNATGQAAEEEYIKDRLETEVDRAASKYGFTSRQTQTKVSADQAALRQKKAQLDAEVTYNTARSTVVPGKNFDVNQHEQLLQDTKSTIKALTRDKADAIASKSGAWTIDKAQELRRLKQLQSQKEIQYINYSSIVKNTDAGKQIINRVANSANLPSTSDEIQEFFNGNPDKLVRHLTNGKYDYNSLQSEVDKYLTTYAGGTGGATATGYRGMPAIIRNTLDIISPAKSEYNNLINNEVKGKPIGLDANILSIRDKTGKDIISESLTDNVDTNPAAYLIDDGTGREIPLDQFRADNELLEGYNMNVSLLGSRIGGRDAYAVSFIPTGKDASDREQISRVIYPGKGSGPLEQHNNERIMKLALESGGVRVKDDRSPINYGLDANALQTTTENKDLYRIGQAREAERIFSDGFSGIQKLIESAGYIPEGSYDVSIPVAGQGMKKVKLVASPDPNEGFITLKVINPTTGKELPIKERTTSLKDLYVELLKNDYKLKNPNNAR